MLKRYKIILVAIVILLLLCVCKEVNAAGPNLCELTEITKVKNYDGSVQLVLPKDTVVKYIARHETNKKYALCEYRIIYKGKKYVRNGYIYIASLNVNKNADYKYVNIETLCRLKYESVVKNSNGTIQFVLPANTVVKYIEHHNTNKKYALCEYKVNYKGEKYVKRGYMYVSSLKVDLTATLGYVNIKDENALNVIRNKAQIIFCADYINKLGVTYSDTIKDRVAFYKNFQNINKPKTDCASLCATIYNRALGYSLYRDSAKTNVWTVPYFVDNAENKFYYTDTGRKGTQGFYIVNEITNGKGSIPLKNMQVGDCVALGKSYARDENGDNTQFDHIYMYIGDGALIESIYYDGGNDCQYERVIKRYVPDYFYTAQRGDGAGQWYYIILMRPLYKYMSKK